MPEALASLSPEQIVKQLGQEARAASRILAQTSVADINSFLDSLAAALKKKSAAIIEANKKDIAAAKQKGLNAAMIDRLMLDEKRIEGIAKGVEIVKGLEDPVGITLKETKRPNGLVIHKVSVPIGVLGMIYESRPNVTVDAAILALKSRNAIILRGGSESLNSSLALHKIIQETLKEGNLPPGACAMIPTGDREAVGAMLRAADLIDVMIPRGGRGLIERVMNEARMPVFGHLEGICHIYVHPSVKPELARKVVLNAKMRRTGICGAMETLILDAKLETALAKTILNDLIEAGCEIVGDKLTQGLDKRIGQAATQDWHTEYLDAKLSVCTVTSVEEAVNHINGYGSHHTDSILAEDKQAVDYFLKNVDSGIVMHNASTQFADGGEFGMGAEIGIATGKLHARGPVALEQLCTYKYIVRGSGQVRP